MTTTQSNLQGQCNPYQSTDSIFHRTGTKNVTVCMETQKTLNSQSNLEKGKHTNSIISAGLAFFSLRHAEARVLWALSLGPRWTGTQHATTLKCTPERSITDAFSLWNIQRGLHTGENHIWIFSNNVLFMFLFLRIFYFNFFLCVWSQVNPVMWVI